VQEKADRKSERGNLTTPGVRRLTKKGGKDMAKICLGKKSERGGVSTERGEKHYWEKIKLPDKSRNGIWAQSCGICGHIARVTIASPSHSQR
jgi:hypothetical protein